MGYEVHITRKAVWFEDDGAAISLKEWLEYVSSDPEMRADGYAEAQTPDGVLRVDDPGIAVWTAYPGYGVDENMAWFCHFGDRVTVKNPDAAILRKMYQIASSLNAQVQGDEGEVYGPSGEPEAAPAESSDARRKPWWRFWE
jgi:hypothetical protein